MKQRSEIILEAVCFNSGSVLAAASGGADRIELCAAPSEGGITPSHAMIRWALSAVTIPVFIMIRPRGGDFLYSREEVEIMKQDILECRSLGVPGVVFGILKKDGSVNFTLCKELVKLAHPMSCTFHRAFDMTKDKIPALEDVIGCGFERILTSGGEQSAQQGKQLIAELHRKAGGRIIVMPGGGVNVTSIETLAEFTGLKEYHVSGRKYIPGGMEYYHGGISISADPLEDRQSLTVDPEQLQKIRQLAERALPNVM